MSKCPHLHRRGNVLYFRLSVPVRFRSILKVSELTASLHTQERKKAIPAAYKLAGDAKTLFLYLDGAMTDKNDYDYDGVGDDLLRAVCDKLEKDEKIIILSLSPLAQRIIAERDNSVAAAKRREAQSVLQVKADAFDKLQPVAMIAPVAQQESVDTVSRQSPKKRSKSPRLSVVRESQIDNLDKSTHAANKKTRAAKWWDVFIELAGDKQVDELEQIDIDYYLEEVCFLPSNDGAPEYKGLTYKDQIKLCKKNKSETISNKTFINSYRTQIKKIVEYGYKEFKGSGFKKLVVDSSNKYNGNQEAGKGEQRHLTIAGVDKLVNNDVMRGYIDNQDTVHNE